MEETETRDPPASDAGGGRFRSSRLYECTRLLLCPLRFRWRAPRSLDANTGLEDEWGARSRLRGDGGAGVGRGRGSRALSLARSEAEVRAGRQRRAQAPH